MTQQQTGQPATGFAPPQTLQTGSTAQPSAPSNDPFANAATAQGQSSQANVNQQTVANRANQTNPFGSSSWSVDPNTGQWTQNVSLAGAQNNALTAQQNLQAGRSTAAQGMLGSATSALSTPLDTSQFHGMYNFGSPGQVNQQAQDAVMGQMQPQLDQRRKAAETQLANQGITRGSEAWQNAEDQLGRDENNARLQGVQAGFQQGNTDFSNNIALGNYQQGQNQASLGQQQAVRSQGLNDINALTSGQQVQAPTFGQYGQAGVATSPNYLGAAQSQYNAILDATNAQADKTSSFNNGLFNLGGAFLGSQTGQNWLNSAGGFIGGLFGMGG